MRSGHCQQLMTKAPVISVKGLVGNRCVPIAVILVVFFQLLYTYAPPMHALREITALSPHQWMLIVLVTSSVLFLVEAEKSFI